MTPHMSSTNPWPVRPPAVTRPDDVKRVLLSVTLLLRDPAHWATQAYARDADACPIDFMSGAACTWCLEGAIRRQAYNLPLEIREETFDLLLYLVLRRMKDATRISHYNDTAAHADILRLIEEAVSYLSLPEGD